MKLLTKAIRASLPPLGGQEGAAEPIAHVKFFTPDGAWTWYATEGSPEGGDFMFFGYVIGFVPEWGYFRLSELESVRGHLNLPVERDLSFEPTPISKFIKPFP
jgi:hypothetical protein